MKKTLAGLLVSCMLFGLVFGYVSTNALAVNDLKDSADYSKDAIVSLEKRGVITGDENGNFFPKQEVSRERLVVLIARALNLDISSVPATPDFKDVPSTHWAYPYIEAAFKAGIISGISDDAFGTGQICTREQMAAIISRACGFTADAYDNSQYASITSFTDYPQISAWAKVFVNKAVEQKLMFGVGDSSFSPKSSSTMEQAAVILNRFLSQKDADTNTDGNIRITLNGDIINTMTPVEKNGTILLPYDFLRYFTGPHYLYDSGILSTQIVKPAEGSPYRLLHSVAKIGDANVYVTDSNAFDYGNPFTDPDAFKQYKVECTAPPQKIDSTLYVPVEYIAAVTGSTYKLENNVLKLTSASESAYPTLKEALKKSTENPINSELNYSMKADFYDTFFGYRMNDDFNTTGQYHITDPSAWATQNDYREMTKKVRTTDFLKGTNTSTLADNEKVKVGGDLYLKNAKTGKYELQTLPGTDKSSDDFSFVYSINKKLYNYFISHKELSIHNSVYVGGQKTTQYTIFLQDIKDIAYLFGNGNNATINGNNIEFNKVYADPFPTSYFLNSFFGDHTSRSVKDDFVGFPKYTYCSAKLDIYVNDQNEIVKEVFHNSGNRDDYSIVFQTQDRLYHNVDYNYTYDIEFQPFNGSISLDSIG